MNGILPRHKINGRGNHIRSSYFYIPIGMNLTYKNTPCWTTTLNAEYDYFGLGMQKTTYIHERNVGGRRSRRKQGYDFKTSVEIRKEFCDFSIGIKPYFRMWEIKGPKKKASSTLQVPTYKANDKKKEIGVGFNFHL